jgi:starvation-inducible outer membrane lipoprotein
MRLAILISALAILLSICYTYSKGLQDGEQWYKQSHRMYMALKSAYHYGYIDAYEGRCESWEGDCDD